MHPLRVVPFFAVFALGGTGDLASAQPKESAAAEKAPSAWVFSLLPKAFQKNPRLAFNVFTEMTPEGRRRPLASSEGPVYYIAQTGTVFNGGLLGPDEHLDPLAVKQLPVVLARALAENGYRPAEGTGRAPSVAIIYQFGSYSFNPPPSVADIAPDGDVPAPERDVRRALLTRALLLGGQTFAEEVSDAMERVDQKALLERTFVAPEGGESFMGSVGAMLPEPFERLRAQNAEKERLIDELFSSSYFVVASAYDLPALTHGRRILLWRTKMTVNSLGVNMAESLPPLIESAAPYLGRETKAPVALNARITRSGHVDVGSPILQEHTP
jgi:hypothetical protein